MELPARKAYSVRSPHAIDSSELEYIRRSNRGGPWCRLTPSLSQAAPPAGAARRLLSRRIRHIYFCSLRWWRFLIGRYASTSRRAPETRPRSVPLRLLPQASFSFNSYVNWYRGTETIKLQKSQRRAGLTAADVSSRTRPQQSHDTHNQEERTAARTAADRSPAGARPAAAIAVSSRHCRVRGPSV